MANDRQNGSPEQSGLPLEQLEMANAMLQRRIKTLEHGVMQEYVEMAGKVVEGFCQIVVDAQNGNPVADTRVHKFLDALRLAQGKPVKLPRLIHRPDGTAMMVEPENESEALPELAEKEMENARAD